MGCKTQERYTYVHHCRWSDMTKWHIKWNSYATRYVYWCAQYMCLLTDCQENQCVSYYLKDSVQHEPSCSIPYISTGCCSYGRWHIIGVMWEHRMYKWINKCKYKSRVRCGKTSCKKSMYTMLCEMLSWLQDDWEREKVPEEDERQATKANFQTGSHHRLSDLERNLAPVPSKQGLCQGEPRED